MKLMLRLLLFIFLLIEIKDAAAQDNPKFEQPVLISSAGQSADVKLAGLLLKREKVESVTALIAKPADLEGKKTLILVPGFSSKGLGAAGISAEEELERVKGIIEKANEGNVPIILLHIGGNARRKGQSDQFIKLVAESAKYMIVVKQADEDNFFSDLKASLNIPLVLVDKIPSAAEPLGKLFK